MLHLLAPLLVSVLCVPALAQEVDDVVPGVPFEEGDTITFESIAKLKGYLPPEFWENREFFFYEGMALEIGPFFRDYENNEAYEAASARFLGQATIGKDGALETFSAGRPFHGDDIDCAGDPQAGTKIIWNMMKA